MKFVALPLGINVYRKFLFLTELLVLEQRVTNEVMVKKGKNDKSAEVDKTQETRVKKKNAREEIKPSTDEYPRT